MPRCQMIWTAKDGLGSGLQTAKASLVYCRCVYRTAYRTALLVWVLLMAKYAIEMLINLLRVRRYIIIQVRLQYVLFCVYINLILKLTISSPYFAIVQPILPSPNQHSSSVAISSSLHHLLSRYIRSSLFINYHYQHVLLTTLSSLR